MDTTMYEFDPLEPGDPRTVGGYVLRARIGAGGMGRVYLSFTPGGRAVAVKIIRAELGSDPEFRERFAREVSIAQQVNGIHIAQLIDAGTDHGVPWLASAYVAGPSLAQVVTACGPLPPDTVLALAGRIAESLGAIHATGIVHRDLKPGNILLDESGPKVIDFGIVRAAAPTATGRSGHRTFIGSPPFMAPEQIRGQQITPATDVFALGATLYHLCTGESAFQADFADGVLYRVIHDEPDYDACPAEVRELIRGCLRKSPDERPGTQRIVDGCRAAGASQDTPLPDAVRVLIRARAQALAVAASRSEAGPELGAKPAQTDSSVLSESVPEPAIAEQSSVAIVPPSRGRRGRAVLAAGVSSLVTAVVAVVIAVVLWPHASAPAATTSQKTDQVAATVRTSTNAEEPASGSGSGAGPGSGSGADAIQWHGHVLITISEVDLDAVPANNNASSRVSVYDSTISIDGEGPYQLSALPYASMTLATWTGSAAPDRSQCYDQVSSQGVSQVTVTNGTMVCAITAGGRVALLKVLDDQADGENGIMTDVTVWSEIVPGASSSAAAN